MLHIAGGIIIAWFVLTNFELVLQIIWFLLKVALWLAAVGVVFALVVMLANLNH